jgi:hypothetical protein
VSISLFPGALNADFKGHAGVFLHRVKQLLVAAICLAISGGNFTSLTEDLTADRIRTAVVGTTRAGVAQASSAQDRLTEFSNASLRASTSLYAGTSPEAGQLSGKARI